MIQTVVPVSGGWDSAIVWLYTTGYIRDGHSQHWYDPNAVAVFTDPGREDPKTYYVLDTLDTMTGRAIVRLRGPTWEEALDRFGFYLPWYRARWCTRLFKIEPFQAWTGDREVVSRIGLRADESERVGYLGDNGRRITPVYPLREMEITRADRERIAKKVGLPQSGLWSCDCCPFKNHYLWVLLVEQYPERAEWCAWVEEEKERRGAGNYGWVPSFKIRELINNPVLRAHIRKQWWATHTSEAQLSFWDEEEEIAPCLMCQVK